MSIDKLPAFVKHYNAYEIKSEQDADAIYHYTSPSGLKGIIENGTLRFTDRSFLNDKSEGVYALDLTCDHIKDFELSEHQEKLLLQGIKDRKRENLNESFHVYQCSFSLDPDSLCMWNYYSKDAGIKGYCLKFDENFVSEGNSFDHLVKLKDPPEDSKAYKKNDKIIHGRVIYNVDEQIDIIRDIINYFREYLDNADDHETNAYFVYVARKIQMQGVFFKNPCFEIEHEYRFAIDQYITDNGKFYAIGDERKFMERNGIFIPYVDLEFDKNALSEIKISPTLDAMNTARSIEAICSNKYPNMKQCSQSQIPVRY